MLIPLGFLAASSSSAGSFDLLESTVLTGSQASVEFTNLTSKYASTYQHLQLRITARSSRSAQQDGLVTQLNGDTAGNYSYHILGGNGSSVSSFAGANQTFMYSGVSVANSATANAFSGVVIDILDPFETTKNTTLRTLFANATTEVGLHSGSWRNTASVTSIKLALDTGVNFLQYSRFSLYGLRAA